MVNASRAWKYVHTRCMTFVKWQTTVSIDNTISTSRRSCHSPRWQSLRFVGSPSASWKAVSLKTIMRSSHCRISHCKVFSATLAGAQRPGHHQPPLIEQQTPLPADNPARIREALAADLSRAPTLPNRVDQLHARGVNDARHRRGGQEGLRPGL